MGDQRKHVRELDDHTRKVSDMLVSFGMTMNEAIVYATLLSGGSTTATGIAKKLSMARTNVYSSIGTLLRKDMVTKTFSKPMQFTAIEPQKALNNLIEAKRDDATHLEGQIESFLSAIVGLKIITESPNPFHISIISGRTQVYRKIKQVLEESKGIVYLATNNDDIFRMYHSAVPEAIRRCLSSGGQVRLMIDKMDKEADPFIRKLGVSEVRTYPIQLKGRILVEDGKHLMMSGYFETGKNSHAMRDHVAYTNSTDMTCNLFHLFDLMWKKATPVQLGN
ncbi:MAG: TrmB family transcriptional regulator [Candidatus Micrarchaeales archaeon]